MTGINDLKTGADVLGQVIKLAGDDPAVKQSGRELGKSALTLTKAINNVLLPLAALNYGIDKARAYFADNFTDDLAEKAARITTENLVEPKPSIAGPALQGLAFVHEEAELRERFLELLAAAMDKSRSDLVHPSFVEILRQIDAREAQLLGDLLKNDGYHPIVHLTLHFAERSSRSIRDRHLMNVVDPTSRVPIVIPNQAVYVDNWVRLGLVQVDYQSTVVGDDRYGWVQGRPEYQEAKALAENEGFDLQWTEGVLMPTDFGIRFSTAVGIFKSAAPLRSS